MTDDQETIMFADDGEDYATGDPDPMTIDWGQVEELERRQMIVLATPGAKRSVAMLELLSEMHNGDFEVL